ncbi:hypothetical protein IF2G_10441 [Cordyceps javanica]|nr:hypothetical protein IF2G_10441 [Cordyceps javanica]
MHVTGELYPRDAVINSRRGVGIGPARQAAGGAARIREGQLQDISLLTTNYDDQCRNEASLVVRTGVKEGGGMDEKRRGPKTARHVQADVSILLLLFFFQTRIQPSSPFFVLRIGKTTHSSKLSKWRL